ncbi:MAG TPA: FHA domain-containing protein [Gemmataceae bacterium]|nr:FHA domain-containing protein [Gemmataceae bacterium]
MKLSLMVMSEGKAKGQTIPVTLPQFIIGRDPQCQLRPASAMISKRHCAVLIKGGKAFVRDFGSTNGTFVNEDPVKGERQLHNEDTLKVGPLLFRVVLETSTPVNKPTPPPPAPKADASDDDSVAAMLLALQDDGDSPSSEATATDKDGVPSGTTVHEMMPPLGETKPPEEKAQAEAKPAEKKADPKKDIGDSSQAAAAILQQYTRRQRS